MDTRAHALVRAGGAHAIAPAPPASARVLAIARAGGGRDVRWVLLRKACGRSQGLAEVSRSPITSIKTSAYNMYKLLRFSLSSLFSLSLLIRIEFTSTDTPRLTYCSSPLLSSLIESLRMHLQNANLDPPPQRLQPLFNSVLHVPSGSTQPITHSRGHRTVPWGTVHPP